MLKIKAKKKKSTGVTEPPPAPDLAFLSDETIHLPRIVTPLPSEAAPLSPRTSPAPPSDDELEYVADSPQTKLEEPEDDPMESSLPGILDIDIDIAAKAQWKPTRFDTRPQPVKLNVGGTLFCTSLSTLTSRPSMLSAMFSGRYSPTQDEEGSYFIDRDGTHFRYILNYLRDGFVRLPEDLQSLQELMVESQYYQIPGLMKEICEAPRLSKKEYITIRYLPANTYDGWPIRIEGPLEEHIICELNGGAMPPLRETVEVRNMYGQLSTGWKVRGLHLTKIFNIIASYGWRLTTSNGSGGGKQRNFAEMYVFCRSKLLRRQSGPSHNRRSAAYSYSHLFSFLASDYGEPEEPLRHTHSEREFSFLDSFHGESQGQ